VRLATLDLPLLSRWLAGHIPNMSHTGGAAGGCPVVTVVFRPGRVAVRGGFPPGGVPPARRAGRGVLIQYRTIRQRGKQRLRAPAVAGTPTLHKRQKIQVSADLPGVLRK